MAEGALTMGHARALIGAPDAERLAEQVIARGLSVRETETAGERGASRRQRATRPTRPCASADADIAALERQLADLLGLKVRISHGDAGGSVTLDYSTLDQLDMICQRLSGEPI